MERFLNGDTNYFQYLKEVAQEDKDKQTRSKNVMSGLLDGFFDDKPWVREALLNNKMDGEPTDDSRALNFYGGMLETYHGDVAKLVEFVHGITTGDSYAAGGKAFQDAARAFVINPGKYLSQKLDELSSAITGVFTETQDKMMAYQVGNDNTRARMNGQALGELLATVGETAAGEGAGVGIGAAIKWGLRAVGRVGNPRVLARMSKMGDSIDMLDCSDIASILQKETGTGEILNFEMKQNPMRSLPELNLKVPQGGNIENYAYHQVYTDGKYIYDPTYSPNAIREKDYIAQMKKLNPGVVITRGRY